MPTKNVRVRAHDRVDGSHVRQHNRRIESARPYEGDELPPEGDYQVEEPVLESSSPGPADARKTNAGKAPDTKEKKGSK